MRVGGRIARAVALAVGITAFAAPSAGAVHHNWLIEELYLGDGTNPHAVFVELSNSVANQHLIAGNQLDFYSASGGALASVTISSNAPDTSTAGKSLLYATSQAQTQLGVTANQTITLGAVINPNGGGLCYGGPGGSVYYDCVTWGGYTGPALGSPAGTPAPAIPDGCSLDRGADTNSSSADFVLTSPTPRNYAGQVGGGPACVAGPGPPDDDADGVPNRADQCPDTPGTPVNGCPPDPPTPPPSPSPPLANAPVSTGSLPTGQRAAALKKCKKKRSREARRKCITRAKKLPV